MFQKLFKRLFTPQAGPATGSAIPQTAKKSPAEDPWDVHEKRVAAQKQWDRIARVDGKLPHEWSERVKELKRTDLAAAERILTQMVQSMYRASRETGIGFPAGFHEELAIVLRKQGRKADELALLREFRDWIMSKGGPNQLVEERLLERLAKAEGLSKADESVS